MKNKRRSIILSAAAVLVISFIALYAFMHYPRTVEFTVEMTEENTGETRMLSTELTLTRTIFGNKRISGTMTLENEKFYLKSIGDTCYQVGMYKEKPLASKYMNNKKSSYKDRENSYCGMCVLDTNPNCISGVFITLFCNENGYGSINHKTIEAWRGSMTSLPEDVVAAIGNIIY